MSDTSITVLYHTMSMTVLYSGVASIEATETVASVKKINNTN